MALPRNLSARPIRQVLATPGLLLFVIALLPRLYRLGAQSLWLDEGGTWSEVTGRTGKGWLALLGELWSKDAAYPLYHLLLKAWVTVAGDSEWALRFPSALAGATTAAVLYYAALELIQLTTDDGQQIVNGRWSVVSLVAALLFALSPFALWYAQDAKVYSLLMLAVALEIWALLRALDRPGPHSWLMLGAISLASLFVHRLALLPVAGAALAYAIVWPTKDEGRRTKDARSEQGTAEPSSLVVGRSPSIWRIGVVLLAFALAVGGVAGTILAVRGESRSAGGHIQAGPLPALWLTFTRFSLDRWPGDIAGYLGLPLALWLLPCTALTLWGLALLIRDALARCPGAIAILCMAGVPLALLLLALALMAVPIYEARYATVAFPAWLLLLAYPFAGGRRMTNDERSRLKFDYSGRWSLVVGRWSLVGGLLVVNVLLLFQPNKGLFSGDPLKEQWRESITAMAARAHPDDLLILHPYYVQPLWDYYAPRVIPNSLAAVQPVVFTNYSSGYFFKDSYEGLTPEDRAQRIRRDQDNWYDQQAAGKKRVLLLIAPAHSRLIDPINSPNDLYGWLGLRFQFAEHAWFCGKTGFVGVDLLCLSYPEAYKKKGPASILEPTIRLSAIFGGELHLRGYSIDPFGGVVRPGGTLPITLYWEAVAKPSHDYTMFLHLCRDCSTKPLVQDDGPPLGGDYSDPGHTTTWVVHDPVHDERSLILPQDLPPGHYTLLLGVYPVSNPSEQARLPVASAAPVLGGTRLVLGEIEIGKP